MNRYFLNTDPTSGEVHLRGGCNMMQGDEDNARYLGTFSSISSAVLHAQTNVRNRRLDANPCERCATRERGGIGRR